MQTGKESLGVSSNTTSFSHLANRTGTLTPDPMTRLYILLVRYPFLRLLILFFCICLLKDGCLQMTLCSNDNDDDISPYPFDTWSPLYEIDNGFRYWDKVSVIEDNTSQHDGNLTSSTIYTDKLYFIYGDFFSEDRPHDFIIYILENLKEDIDFLDLSRLFPDINGKDFYLSKDFLIVKDTLLQMLDYQPNPDIRNCLCVLLSNESTVNMIDESPHLTDEEIIQSHSLQMLRLDLMLKKKYPLTDS